MNIQSTAQSGAVLITALIFLVVMTVLSLTAVRSSTLELRMANNEEGRLAAIQRAQAMTDAVLQYPSTTPVIGGAGYTICTPLETGCNRSDLIIPGDPFAADVASGDLRVRIERMIPPERPPPRGIESSIDKFTTAAFSVNASYDGTDQGGGQAQVVQGLLVLVPLN